MNFQFYVEKLFDSEVFQNFIKENPDAYPCSGYFVIDRENLKNPENKHHIDYFVPSIKKMFSFNLEKGVEIIPVEFFGDKNPEKIPLNFDFDFEDIEDIVREKIKEEKINNKVQKLLFSLQKLNDKDFLVGTLFLSSLGMIKINISLPDKKVWGFEKKSFMDMFKILKKDDE